MDVGAAEVLTETVEKLLEGSGPDSAGAEGLMSLHCWASASAALEPSKRVRHRHDCIQCGVRRTNQSSDRSSPPVIN